MIDRIVCINLLERNDRLIESKLIFDSYGLNVEYYRTERDKNSGQRDCFNSHVAVIKKAHEDGLNNILIFEDDISCDLSKEKFNSTMNLVYDFINSNNYDIFFLGSCPKIWTKMSKKVNDRIFKLSAYLAHAYILSKAGIKKYAKLKYNGSQIDEIYSDSNEAYAILPSIFYQNNSQSNILHSMNKTPTKTKIYEWYARNIRVPVSWICLLLLIIALKIYTDTNNTLWLIFVIMLMVSIIIMYTSNYINY